MDQLILRNDEQGIVTEQETQNQPRRRRGQHHGAKHGCVQVAYDFLEGVDNRGQRSVKCGRNRRRRSHGYQRLDIFGAQSQPTRKDRAYTRADENRRPFRTQRNAAAQSYSGAEKFSEDCSEGDDAITSEEGYFCLSDAAAPGVRKISD